MKTIAPFRFTSLLAGIATAGQTTIFNDTTDLRFVRIPHKGRKLAAAWLLPGRKMGVEADDSRRGKPLLMMDVPNLWQEQRERDARFYILPKKPAPLFLGITWFTQSIGS